MKTQRRHFIKTIGAIAAWPSGLKIETEPAYPYPISSNAYNWITFYGRQNKNWGEDLNECFMALAKTGIPAYEPSFGNAQEVIKLVPFLKKYNIKMPSVYIGTVLHDETEAKNSIASVLAIADEIKKLGAKIVVTNPNPLEWGSNLLKSDKQLLEQSKNMELLGKALKNKGLTLAYHTHDTEMKAGAREFHHIMQNTTPQNVSFCMDVHWVYRGSGNSEVAVFDILKMYGKRIVELHIRQSVDGVWSETFGQGDIDYGRLARQLKTMNLRPHLVIEQCLEDKTPNTLSAIDAHIQDLANIKTIFKPILD
jgi:inosose dehydratase